LQTLASLLFIFGFTKDET